MIIRKLLLPYLFYSSIYIAISSIFTWEYTSLSFMITVILILLPGYLLSRYLFMDINSWDARHIAGAFAFSMAIFAIPGNIALGLHLSSKFAFISALLLLGAVGIASFILFILKKRIKEEVEPENPFPKTSPKFIYISSLAIITVSLFHFYIIRDYLSENPKIGIILLSLIMLVFSLIARRTIRKSPVHKTSNTNRFKIEYLYIFILILIIFLNILRNTNSLRFGVDNSFHQSMITDFLDSNSLNRYEPMFGEKIELLSFFLFSNWELFNAFISDLSNTEPFRIYNYFLPILLILLTYAAGWSFLRQIFGKYNRNIYLGLAAFGVLNIWAKGKPWGYINTTIYIHHPESVFMFILLPYFYFLFIKLKANPSKFNYIALFITTFISASIHIMALPFLSVVILIDAIYEIFKTKKFDISIIYRFSSMILPALLGFLIYLKLNPLARLSISADSPMIGIDYVKLIAVNLALWVAISVVGLLIYFFKDRKERGIVIGIVIFLLIIVFTPGIRKIVYTLFTPAMSGRIPSLLPVFLLFGFWFAYSYYNLEGKGAALVFRISLPLIAIAIIVISFLNYAYMIPIKIKRPANPYKIEYSYAGIIDFYTSIDKNEKISVIADESVSSIIPCAHGRSKMFVVTIYHLRNYYNYAKARDRIDMMKLLYTKADRGWNLDPTEFQTLLEKREVTDVVLNRYQKLKPYPHFLRKIGYKEAFKDKSYIVMRKKRQQSVLKNIINEISLIWNKLLNIEDCLLKNYYQLKFNLSKNYADYFSKLMSTNNTIIFAADYSKRAHFGNGFTEIISYPRKSTAWFNNRLIKKLKKLSIKYPQCSKSLEYVYGRLNIFLRNLKQSSTLYLKLKNKTEYNVKLYLRKIFDKKLNVTVEINGKNIGDFPVLDQPTGAFSVVLFPISKAVNSHELTKIKLKFDHFIEFKMFGAIEKERRLSADIFAVEVINTEK